MTGKIGHCKRVFIFNNFKKDSIKTKTNINRMSCDAARGKINDILGLKIDINEEGNTILDSIAFINYGAKLKRQITFQHKFFGSLGTGIMALAGAFVNVTGAISGDLAWVCGVIGATMFTYAAAYVFTKVPLLLKMGDFEVFRENAQQVREKYGNSLPEKINTANGFDRSFSRFYKFCLNYDNPVTLRIYDFLRGKKK